MPNFRNIEGIRVKKGVGLLQTRRKGPPVRYDFPGQNRVDGALLQTVPILGNTLTAEVFRVIRGVLEQNIPLFQHLLAVSGTYTHKADLKTTLPLILQELSGNAIKRIIGQMNLTLPLPLHTILGYEPGDMADMEMYDIHMREMWANLIAADGAFVSGFSQTVPQILHTILEPQGGPFYLRVQPTFVEPSYRYLSFNNEFFEEETTGIPSSSFGADQYENLGGFGTFEPDDINILSMRITLPSANTSVTGDELDTFTFTNPPSGVRSFTGRNPFASPDIELNWIAPQFGAVTDYEIQASVGAGAYSTIAIVSSEETSLTTDVIQFNETNNFRIRARADDDGGFVYSGWSTVNIAVGEEIDVVPGTYQSYAASGATYDVGDIEEYVVPTTGNYYMGLFGGSGGNNPTDNQFGGAGAAISHILALTAGDVLTIRVGKQGKDLTGGTWPDTFFGGGGSVSTDGRAGTGGGASDVRLNGDTLADRIIVAAGGGGAGYDFVDGGAGGYPNGFPGGNWNGYGSGQPGTQTAGGAQSGYIGAASAGSLGQGGKGQGSGVGGGGGGGGYYGGGGSYLGGGGGGSSYFSGTLQDAEETGTNIGDGSVVIFQLQD